MIELFKFQICLFILILFAELIFFVNASSKKETGVKRPYEGAPTLKSSKKSGAKSSSSGSKGQPHYNPKLYRVHYDYKKVELDHKLEKLKRERDLKNSKEEMRVFEVDKTWAFEQTYDALKKLSVEQMLNCEIYLKGDNAALEKWKLQNWYSALMLDIFDHHRGLYHSTQNNSGLLIDPASIKKKYYLHHFRFIGKMLALGIHRQLRPSSVQLGRIFLKTILKREIYRIDVEAADPGFYQKLMDVEKNPINYSFTLNGEPLEKNGDQIEVTNKNVDDYMKLAIDYKYNKSVSEQIKAFLDGFNLVFPLELLNHFKPSDLEILLYGIPVYPNLNHWPSHVKVVKHSQDRFANAFIDRFWEIMREWIDPTQQLKMLYFITGTIRYTLDKNGKLEGNLFEIYVDLDKNGEPLKKSKKKFLPTTDITAKRLYLFNECKEELRKQIKDAVENSDPF